jgi:hypothetical protein
MDRQQNPGQEREPFETRDLSPTAVFSFLLGLVVMCLLVALLAKGVYWALDRYDQSRQPPANPLVNSSANAEQRREVPHPHHGDSVRSIFPEPRLEDNERGELKSFRLGEEEELNSFGWVDEKAGVAHIPIESAMQLIAQRGLPVHPQAGTTPPSAVNTARKAAAKADRSGMQPKPAQPPKDKP